MNNEDSIQGIMLSIMNLLELETFDYTVIQFMGKGAFSSVIRSVNTKTGKESAIKVIDKKFLEKERKQHHVYIEKEILIQLKHPGVIKLYSTFQSDSKIFFELELCCDGDFNHYLKNHYGRMNYEAVKFYTAEILLILEYIHQQGIAHRDLKAENLLMTKTRHLKLIDFATALVFNDSKLPVQRAQKIRAIREKYGRSIEDEDQLEQKSHFTQIDKKNQQFLTKSSFVGTSAYLSPELLDLNMSGPASDLWALGCLLYKMLVGKTPFEDEIEYQMFQKISNDEVSIPSHVPKDAIDLLRILLNKDPMQRFDDTISMDNYHYDSLKWHPFFYDINFENMWDQDVPLLSNQQIISRKTMLRPMTVYDLDLRDSPTRSFSQKQDNFSNNEKEILKGVVLKEGGILLLYSFTPRFMTLEMDRKGPILYYINQSDNNKKVTSNIILLNKTLIKLSSLTLCRLINQNKFIIQDHDKKKYIFQEKEHPAALWVEQINNSIKYFQLK